MNAGDFMLLRMCWIMNDLVDAGGWDIISGLEGVPNFSHGTAHLNSARASCNRYLVPKDIITPFSLIAMRAQQAVRTRW